MNIVTTAKCRIWALPLLFVLTTGCIAGETVSCPETIALEAATVRIESASTNFSPYVEKSTIRLSGMSAFDGPPSEGASLVPNSISQDKSRITWNFSAGHVQNGWLSCDYSEGLVRLTRKVTSSTKRCVAMVSITGPGRVLRGRFECD